MKVIQQSIALYRKGMVTCLPLSILCFLGILSPHFLFRRTNQAFYVNFMSWQDYKSVVVLFSWFISFIALSALIVRIDNLYQNQTSTLSEDLLEGLSEFFPLLFIALLYAFLVVCGIAALIVPGIILSVSLMFSFIIRLTDHTEVLDSLVKSHRLVWGHWWYTLSVSTVPYLFNIIAFLGFYLVLVCTLTHYGSSYLSSMTSIALVLNGVLLLLFIPFIIGTAICLLYDLKSKRLPSELIKDV